MKKAVVIFCVVFVICRITLATMPMMQEGKPKSKRVKRPTFEKDDSTYFKNVFKEALVGDRPAAAKKGTTTTTTTRTTGGGGETTPSTETTDASADGMNWSSIITAELIQAEMKSLSNSFNQHVTSPGKFKSGGNRDVRQAASMAAMLFGVIAEYDGEVKWKEFAAGARDAFAQCAQSATTTSTQAFNQAKNRKTDLQAILSGSPYEPPVKPSPDFEWASVADVSELMKRLASSYREKIKPWSGSASEYKSNIDDLLREAAMVAVIAEILKKESMENAENDDYLEFAEQLKGGAMLILNSKASMDQEMAVKGAGMIDQSCQNCHAEYN